VWRSEIIATELLAGYDSYALDSFSDLFFRKSKNNLIAKY